MSEAAAIDGELVGEAVEWATRLVDSRSREHGDTDRALRQVAHDYRLGYWTLWALRRPSRRPKSVLPSIWWKLKTAWALECARQAKLYEHERRRTEEKTWLGRDLMGAADRLAGSDDGMVK